MTFTFLKASGEVAFFRADAEQAEWTQEEMTLQCTFPYNSGKVIERGMTVLFNDPADNSFQAYEIRTCTMFPGESYQQFTAESIAISELTDCHIPGGIELTSVTAAQALTQVLTGTGWNVGDVNATAVSSADIGRGSVWEAVRDIRTNWNVYVMPRVTVNSGGIVGKYLDIYPPEGTWRGLRIAVDKNVSDPCVTYDDSDLYTALYGYGAMYTEGEGDERQTLETNFAGVTWQKTSEHPAKPSGQVFLEYPEKTALFGRKGKPRFGYYQDTNIKNPVILLQKTWEALQKCCDPKISVTGTVTDLKRLGLPDVPMRLHDMAVIELQPVGILLYKQVIKLTVDLLDPTANRPTIGDYIPNIIYINRETEDEATGGGKGVKGTRAKKKQGEFETNILQNEVLIDLNAKQLDVHGDIFEQAGMKLNSSGVLIYAENKDNMIGSMFHVQKDMIETEVHDRTQQGLEFSSQITQTKNQIALEVSERKGADTSLSSRITQTKNQIALEVSERKGADTSLSSRITQTATEISQEVKRATLAEGTLSGRITVNSNKVALVVTQKDGVDVVNTAEIVGGINDQTGSYVKIKADTINLSGYVTATQLNAVNAKIDNLTSGNTNATKIWATDLLTSTATISTLLTYQGHQITTLNAYNRNGENIAVLGWRQD